MQLTINLSTLDIKTRSALFLLLGLTDVIHAKQEQLPLEEVKEVKTRAKRTETAVEPTNAPKEGSEPVSGESSPTIDLAALKELAQLMVTKVDRQKVKDAISKYSDKLSSVSESDYEALMADLQKLGE
jgi:hypothetical protein